MDCFVVIASIVSAALSVSVLIFCGLCWLSAKVLGDINDEEYEAAADAGPLGGS